ncbi:MAG: C25 family cysteine peptidase [Planctomycetota bacterium]
MSPPLVALLLAVAASPVAEPTLDTVVVCPTEFRQAMKPWLELRTSQGHQIGVLSNLGSAEEIRGQILRRVQGGRLRFVLLVGGADPMLYKDAVVRARSVPMHYAKARVNVKWGSTPTIPTDNWYVQTDKASDENPVPAVAIGRLPAESPEELTAIIKKIVAYERSTDFGPWRQRMNFVAGVGNFGPLADTVLESAAKMFLTQNIPAEYHVSMTYGNWRSPYCPDPRRIHEAAIERLDEGSLFWVYIGHSAISETARMEVPGGDYPILEAADASALRGEVGRPIAMFLSCYAGALDARDRCLASALIGSPGGPVAVVAGTRVTMPYALTVMATNLTNECFRGRCETLGEAMLHAKQNMLKEPSKDDARRAMLDSIASMISPSGKELAVERAEHVLMFNLIGDPLLRMRHPKPMEVRIAKAVPAGGSLQIDGTSPIDGRATVELVLRRDRIRGSWPSRSVYPAGDEELASLDEVYQRANDRRVKRVELGVREGRFQTQIDVPAEAAGEYHVCVFVAGKTDMAMGSAAVEVVRPRKSGSIMAAMLP